MRDEVCVVGAGGAGLAAGQALGARGIAFRIFEARGGIGGMWRHGETYAYDALTSNTSRYRTSFRAHRMRLRGRPYIHHTEFLAYLEAFAARFGLDERIELNARVERAEPAGDGWSVTIAGREPEPFRAVVVATGFLGKPRHARDPRHVRRPHAPLRRVPVAGGVRGQGRRRGRRRDVRRRDRRRAGRPRAVGDRRGAHRRPRLAEDVPARRPDGPHGHAASARCCRGASGAATSPAVLRLAVGAPGKRGMPVPDHRVFDRVVSMSDTFVRALKRGRFTIRPGIERFDGEPRGLRRRLDAAGRRGRPRLRLRARPLLPPGAPGRPARGARAAAARRGPPRRGRAVLRGLRPRPRRAAAGVRGPGGVGRGGARRRRPLAAALGAPPDARRGGGGDRARLRPCRTRSSATGCATSRRCGARCARGRASRGPAA